MKKKKLNSKNPKYFKKDKVKSNIIRKFEHTTKNGVKVYSLWTKEES